MDLEVVGRHALFFDDDSMAAFVNSSVALVEWNNLPIDRYDVRHLLSSPPPRPKRRRTYSDDPDLESELEHERYLDLPAESPSPPQDQNDSNDVSKPTNSGGFNAVPFLYGSTSESSDQKHADTESGFHPPFPVPEYLLLNLPPTEKLHQIIARTAIFVSKHGGQSEIVLRVKQGGNPTFGFLMPDHRLHPYFRFLVEHQELLTGKSFEEDKKSEGELGIGALSLLGSVYGTGEDEDTKSEVATDSKMNESDEGDNEVKAAVPNGPKGSEGVTKLAADGYTVSKHPLLVKDKASVIKRNPSVSTVNVGDMNNTKKEDGSPEKLSASADKLESTVMQTQPKFELPIVEPPADMKRVIDKIVEFILRNGKEFEAILAAQDVKYGRFPFLLPASLYHAYYSKVLQEAEESKSSGKGNISEKRDKKQEKRAAVAKEDDKPAIGSDMPDDSAKKERFKMVIGKPKKDVLDEPSKPVQPQIGVTIDADAAAAILQAARRGIKNPSLGILSSNSFQGLGSDSSQPLSQPFSLTKNIGLTSERLVSGPAAEAIAKTAALAAASEADSSEAGLSKEQMLKAERLKRAKMFMAMLKSGAEAKAGLARSLSIEPPDSGISGSGANAVEPAVREREGSSVPFDAEKKHPDDKNNERRSKRNYRSRYQSNEDDEKDEEEISREEDTDEPGNKKQLRRNRRSDHSRDRQKHKRRHSSKDIHSRDRHKDDSSSDNEPHRRSRHRHKHSKSSHKHELDDFSDNEHRRRNRSSKHKHAELSDDEHHHRHRSSKHKYADSSDDEYQHRHRSSRHKHADSSDDGHRRRHRSSKHKHKDSSDDENGHQQKSSKRRKKEKKKVDEEIVLKSDQSKATDERKASREGSIDSGNGPSSRQSETTQVSEELRAKIRAMLAGTL